MNALCGLGLRCEDFLLKRRRDSVSIYVKTDHFVRFGELVALVAADDVYSNC